MYTGLKHLHHYLPYLLLALLVIAPIVFFIKRSGNKPFTKSDKWLALSVLILAHLQLVVGLILYFVSPLVQAAFDSGALMSDASYRFYAVEHITVMVLAIILITVGYSKAKRKAEAPAKFQNLAIFYLLGLVLILLRIPWDVWPA